ncbi:M48 family metalloprotease [Thiolapillus brandeum]|uniref:Putative beta-barrel assembly-enhancing protease n=1 Tax=Thiolapillus brandeum TaxID=1076588 RepID=A0A7U6JKG2_9GAMM|nr:M48 family metalloprotease [Thiolapillus brandeum]BAO45385.1 peptidase M48 family protein [Thiolapillus brandeum]
MTHPHSYRWLILVLCISLCVAPLQAWSSGSNELPEIGAASGNLFTPLQEQQLGKTFMRYIRATQPVIDDPLLDDYINKLGNRLVEHSEGKGSKFTFFLVDSPVINAYAGPGGYIGVYTGLVLTTQSESELAAVLAHEITHVTQKHLQRAWYAASNLSLVQSAALVAAVILGATVGGDAAIAAASGAQAAMQQQQINFTRQNEKEADRLGINILHEANFDPRAMPSFFTRMGRANRSYGTELPEFLRTHPVTNSRIADSLGRAEVYSYKQYVDSFHYLLARTTLRERSFHEPRDAISYFTAALEEGRYRDKAAAAYGLALALLRDDQYKKASAQLNALLQNHPDTLEFIVSASRTDMEAGNKKSAIARLEAAVEKQPLSYPLQITLAEFYLRAGKAKTAYRKLSFLASLRPENTHVYKLLAEAAADMGRQAESHQHMAMHYYLKGALEASALQLKIALRVPNLNFYETARLESQLKKVQKEIDDLKEKK